MKRYLALIGALALALLVVPASPASANGTDFACKTKSGIGYNVRVCATYDWHYQQDGTGVKFENVRLFAADGCLELEDKAFDGILTWANNGSRAIGDQWNCDVTWNLELRGPDKGEANIVTHVNVNMNGGVADWDTNLRCDVFPSSGNSDCYWY